MTGRELLDTRNYSQSQHNCELFLFFFPFPADRELISETTRAFHNWEER
jgi:hypothetical protein